MNTLNACLTSLVISFSCLVSVASADESKTLSLICVVDESSGYNWRNKSWVHSTFKPLTYIVEKMPQTSVGCADRQARIAPSGNNLLGCYAIKEVGKKPLWSQLCEEWRSESGVVVRVDCSFGGFDSFEAQIDGPFVLTRTYGAFVELDGKRDSLVLEVGKCSEIAR